MSGVPGKLVKDLKQPLPRIGITIGDPAGIGTEIVLKAIADKAIQSSCVPIIIGDAGFLHEIAGKLGLNADYPIVKNAREILPRTSSPLIFDLGNINSPIEFGAESAATGRASAEFIEKAVELCVNGDLNAIATAPISKNALALANVKFPGHTEMLAALTGANEFAMAFFAGNLRVVLLSIHVSLRQAVELIRKERIESLINLTDRELKRLGVPNPRLAVAALNPHAGENRLFGDEEFFEINPAVKAARARGINVAGAFSADTIFLRAARGEFDAVLALYHDQALIAVKSIAFGEAVNVTIGLPIIRTSVDHGTAFDIAGKNLAEHSSMKTAIMLAAQLSREARSSNKS